MKVFPAKFPTIVILLISASVMTPAICGTQEWSRGEKIEIYTASQYMGSVSTHETISGRKSTLRIDSTFAFGVGVAYNVNDHLNLNSHLLYGATDVRMIGVGMMAVTEDTDLWIWDVNLDYNIMKGRLTPVITGGIGTIGFSGSGFSETDFSYNLGAGVRWDFSDKFFIKAIYKNTWTEIEDTDDRVDFDGVCVSVGFKKK
jgi:opacity protein-like surface antigen